MSDYNIPITSGVNKTSVVNGDRFLTYEGKGVKKLRADAEKFAMVNNRRIGSAYYMDILTFDIIGKSLPCVFTISGIESSAQIAFSVEEYGAISDPDYFNIIDLDEDGMPIYADTVSEANRIQLYKKPIIHGNTLGDRIILKTVDNTPENRLLYKIQESVENAER